MCSSDLEETSKAVNTFNDIKKNNPEGLKEFVANERNMAQLIVGKQVENVNAHLAKLRSEIKRISELPANLMSASEKGEAIRNLRQVEEKILQSINVKSMRERAQI